MHIEQIRTSGLGDSTYVVHHDGVAVVVDPQRDVERFERAVAASGAELRYVLETHLHNDYVSGGRELARRLGAEVVVPAAGAVAWTDYLPAFHHEDLDAGGFTVRPIHTPGHTPEHMSYLLVVDGEPVALFSGGSLLVGSFGRPDLLGAERARGLAKLQFLTMRRLAALPDEVALYPTHGEGSFCTSSGAGTTVSTIGRERATNPLVAIDDEDRFAEALLAPLEPWPSYYAHMGPANLMGPTPAPDPHVPRLDPAHVPADVTFVDIRPRRSFAAGHVPGSIGAEYSDRSGVWVGWLVPFDGAIVLVAEPDQDVIDVVLQLERIGFDHVLGVITDVDRLDAVFGPLATNEVEPYDAVIEKLRRDDPLQILDVRAPAEWQEGHIPGSWWRYLPDLADEGPPPGLEASRPVHVVCATGFRANLAVRFLEDAGFRAIVVDGGGVTEILRGITPAPA